MCLLQKKGALAEHQAAVVLSEVLRVVAACHRRSVCHGDIKVLAYACVFVTQPYCSSRIEASAARHCELLPLCIGPVSLSCSNQKMEVLHVSFRDPLPAFAPVVLQPANFLMARPLGSPLHSVSAGELPPPGWLKAIDFGCAQQVNSDKPLSRRTGTPVYMVNKLSLHCHKE